MTSLPGNGERCFWLIHPKTQTAEIFTSPARIRRIAKNGFLEGDRSLAGFRLALEKVFARLRRA
jgi:hypothetical protein